MISHILWILPCDELEIDVDAAWPEVTPLADAIKGYSADATMGGERLAAFFRYAAFAHLHGH